MNIQDDPCPAKIVTHTGISFLLGTIYGGLRCPVQGFLNAPKGVSPRFRGAFNALTTKPPAIGTSFASVGFTFAACDCTLFHIRKKHDSWNTLASGFLSGAIQGIRRGPRTMLIFGFGTMAIFGIFDGVLKLQEKIAQKQQYIEQQFINEQQKEYILNEIKQLQR